MSSKRMGATHPACMITWVQHVWLLAWGQISYVCTQCKELQVLTEKNTFFWDEGSRYGADRLIDEAFRDIVKQPHFHCSNSHAAEEDESLKNRKQQGGKEGNHPLDGTLFPADVVVSSCIKNLTG